jgi:choice-of-anchor B domain-containing protein
MFAFFLSLASVAQLNMEYKGSIEYDVNLNDIWGYVGETGEYGLVGLNNGVSIVDLNDPENPTEVQFAAGISSTWRDIKTWGKYAYVSNESGDGLMVIDLGNLPNSIDYYNWEPNIDGLGTLNSIHNIWIDENGILYLIGSNLNNGGLVYVDVATVPGSPEYIGEGVAAYSHDAYVRNNKSYCSEIYSGQVSIYDLSDMSNTVLLGSQQTEGTFTHNCWLSDDETILYTTDEVGGAPVGAYDVSDPGNIIELDQFVPYETLGDNVIPHNVHVWEDWLIISYYTDGCILVDGSNPTNMIEVGNFDTFIPQNTGFSGAWGAYPYLPSGLVLISDIGNGLYVLEPTYVNACWLEGTVTESGTGDLLNDVTIEILQTTTFENTDIAGEYATGYAVAGPYTVKFSKPGYVTQEIVADLDNGVTTILDVELVSLVPFSVTGMVTDEETGDPIAEAMVKIWNDEFVYDMQADNSGNFTIPNFFAGTYEVIAGKWGWISECEEFGISLDESAVNMELTEGIYDDFTFDFDWTTSSTAGSGDWEIADPDGTQIQGVDSNPGEDVEEDCFINAYVTGNGGGGAGNDDVDDGVVTLTSPSFSGDLGPNLTFSWWFTNWDNTDANDNLVITVSDGVNEAELLNTDANGPNGQWIEAEFYIYDFLAPAANYTITLITGDDINNGSIVEAALDNFQVEYLITDISNLDQADVFAFPNPSTGELNVIVPGELVGGEILIHNLQGQLVASHVMQSSQERLDLNLAAGVYMLSLNKNGEEIWMEKWIVQ